MPEWRKYYRDSSCARAEIILQSYQLCRSGENITKISVAPEQRKYYSATSCARAEKILQSWQLCQSGENITELTVVTERRKYYEIWMFDRCSSRCILYWFWKDTRRVREPWLDYCTSGTITVYTWALLTVYIFSIKNVNTRTKRCKVSATILEWTVSKKAGIHIHSFNPILIGLFLSIWMQKGGGVPSPYDFSIWDDIGECDACS